MRTCSPRLLAVVVLLAACEAAPPSGAFSPAPAPAPVALPTEAPAPTAADDNPVTKIYAQLEVERGQRANPGPTVEAITAKLDGTGLAPVQLKQYVGKTVHARYCAGGRTTSGEHLAICEYPSAADAAAARDFVATQLPELNGSRLVTVTGATTVTVTGTPVADTRTRYGAVLDGL